MLQNAQHCAPKKEGIYPLQFIEGVYGNSVRAEKSLRTLPEKQVLKFHEMLSKKNTPLVSSRRGSKFTLRIWLRSVASRKTRISIRHAGVNVKVENVEKTAVPFSPQEENNWKYLIIHSPQGFSGIIYNTGWGTLPDCLRCSLQVMKE